MNTPKARPTAGPAIKRESALRRVKDLVHATKVDDIARDARSILVHAALYMDLSGWCFPSATLLADDTGYTEKTVRKALRELRDAGIIVQLQPAAWGLAVQATQGVNVPKGGKLPMLLLWPAASRAARIATFGALSSKPVTLTMSAPPAGEWIVTTSQDFGPYNTDTMERFARTEAGSDAWMVRRSGEAPAHSQRLDTWYWFAAHLPRAPWWVRGA